jgi:hypothetical protein
VRDNPPGRGRGWPQFIKTTPQPRTGFWPVCAARRARRRVGQGGAGLRALDKGGGSPIFMRALPAQSLAFARPARGTGFRAQNAQMWHGNSALPAIAAAYAVASRLAIAATKAHGMRAYRQTKRHPTRNSAPGPAFLSTLSYSPPATPWRALNQGTKK